MASSQSTNGGFTRLVRTLLLGRLGPRKSLQQILENSTPGFTFLHQFFKNWLKLDLTSIAAALTIFGTISGALGDIKILGLKLYWWIVKLFTASISIASNDRLNREVLNWLGSEVLDRQQARILTATSERVQNDAFYYRRSQPVERHYEVEKRVPIQYLPTFGMTWFIHERNVFMVKRIATNRGMTTPPNTPDAYASAPEGDEPLVIICLGRSVAPIKRFLNTCRDFAEKQRESYITVRASKTQYGRESWDVTILRPIRPLETVHFDEAVKAELVADIKDYLDPDTRRFYTGRGIPYRRGYLLHGPPGTGKTSLSLALAGLFGLELYLLHLPSVKEDAELERLFTALPTRCIVLLEDIDAIGSGRKSEAGDDKEEEEEELDTSRPSNGGRCTLSGLLNVLDGVASQEGRIVFMTTNVADKLDQALVRPGRIDRKIFLGNISQRSAELMFLRMFMPDPKNSVVLDEGIGMEELQKFALEFSGKIPNDIFTPAQLQGYLLNHRNTPAVATREVESWVHDEQVRIMIRKEEARKAKERRNQTKRASLKLLSRGLELEYESEVKNGREMARRPRTRRGKDTGGKVMEHETSLDDVLDAMEPNNYNSMEETDEGYIYNSVERKARTVQNHKCEELKDHNPTVANLVSRERRKEAALGIASKEATGCNNEEKTSRGTTEETQ